MSHGCKVKNKESKTKILHCENIKTLKNKLNPKLKNFPTKKINQV